jgi:hypothetical protein
MNLSLIKFAFLFSLLLLFGVFLYAQDRTVQGVILDRSGSSRVSNASLTNKRSAQITLSNDLGLFLISARIGDTLIISKVGYSDMVLVLPSHEDLVLKMQPVIQLSEVTVKGQSKKQELDELKEQYRKKGSYYAGKPPLLAYVFQPLTAIYELIGKTPGQARRFNAYYMTELEQSEIDRRFNALTVKNLTGLDGNDLKNFMIVYRPGYDNMSRWDDYALISYVKRSLTTFNSSGRPKGLLSLPALPKAPDLTEKVLKY